MNISFRNFFSGVAAVAALVLVFGLSSRSLAADADKENQGSAKSQASAAVFRHVVCFKFKDGTPTDKIAEIEREFAALKGKIDTITDFEWGTSENIEPRNKEFTHCFVVTFADKAGLEVYLPHADHEAFKAILLPHLDDVFVFDFSPKG